MPRTTTIFFIWLPSSRPSLTSTDSSDVIGRGHEIRHAVGAIARVRTRMAGPSHGTRRFQRVEPSCCQCRRWSRSLWESDTPSHRYLLVLLAPDSCLFLFKSKRFGRDLVELADSAFQWQCELRNFSRTVCTEFLDAHAPSQTATAASRGSASSAVARAGATQGSMRPSFITSSHTGSPPAWWEGLKTWRR